MIHVRPVTTPSSSTPTADKNINNQIYIPEFYCVSGWLSQARHVLSPNFNDRPANTCIRLVVIHNISLPPAIFTGNAIEQFFLNQLDAKEHPYFETISQLQVSAHVLIRRTGEVIQFVSFDKRAWHAGQSHYLGTAQCNDYSIGIELEGTDDLPFEDIQYQALRNVVLAINQAYPATCQHIAGHSDIAYGRKTDPGRCFDWIRLRKSLGDKA